MVYFFVKIHEIFPIHLQVPPTWKLWRKKVVEVVKDVKKTEKSLKELVHQKKLSNFEKILEKNICSEISKNLVGKHRYSFNSIMKFEVKFVSQISPTVNGTSQARSFAIDFKLKIPGHNWSFLNRKWYFPQMWVLSWETLQAEVHRQRKLKLLPSSGNMKVFFLGF